MSGALFPTHTPDVVRQRIQAARARRALRGGRTYAAVPCPLCARTGSVRFVPGGAICNHPAGLSCWIPGHTPGAQEALSR
jgi:hypothetical protein